MLEITEKEINGATWKTRELDGETALMLGLDIMQVVAPALSMAGKSYDPEKGLLDQKIDVEAIVKELLSRITTEKARSIIVRLLAETWKMEARENGTVEVSCRDHFKTLFAGKRLTRDLLPVVVFVFRENFGDFSGLASITGR
jgi:hypothetical protein